MRIWTVSDLHVDVEPYAWPAAPEHDVLVVAGDTMERLPRALRWIRETAPTDRPIIYVPGNHDAWRMRWPRDLASAHEDARALGIELLASGETVVLGGTRFIGATLWSDFRLRPDREVQSRAEYDHGMLDRKRITSTRTGYGRWLARDAAALHAEHRSAIEAELAQPHDGPTVVVTHHAPHPMSLATRQWEEEIDASYASDLGVLLDGPTAPALWLHGHTHLAVDYRVGGTRVVSNPRGYGDENSRSFDPLMTVEI